MTSSPQHLNVCLKYIVAKLLAEVGRCYKRRHKRLEERFPAVEHRMIPAMFRLRVLAFYGTLLRPALSSGGFERHIPIKLKKPGLKFPVAEMGVQRGDDGSSIRATTTAVGCSSDECHENDAAACFLFSSAIASFLNELTSNGIPSNMIFTSYLAKRRSRLVTRVFESACGAMARGALRRTQGRWIDSALMAHQAVHPSGAGKMVPD
ncbi:hypothetical protein KIN20_015081 [Parelaphostrongylus tenuis]|uniref:Uncharacterized protein n=1 Tax=Parelaphostrongylus tenuis TaxID=148309 RepID=A0AAD5QNR6_PARTN|nr:hypothetical protein KIN20_015081 [Parelaphostrongylus tenuis]